VWHLTHIVFSTNFTDTLAPSNWSGILGPVNHSSSIFYYLARIFNPLVFGSIDPPDVVVRQICQNLDAPAKPRRKTGFRVSAIFPTGFRVCSEIGLAKKRFG
jgi:hypothetical protein